MVKSKITLMKLNKYKAITKNAFDIARKNIIKTNNKKKIDSINEVLQMVECYLKDSEFFENKKDYVTAFAALNYSHGWLDAGARLGFFNVKKTKNYSDFFAV